MAKRTITTEFTTEDTGIETSLRPKFLKDYIGQEKVKNNLKIYIEAARQRNDPLDHVLLYGPPGLGKTTLAGIVANEMDVNLKVTAGPAIEKPGEMAAILNNLQDGDVLFVDEIHRLNRQVEEVLYPAMEDYVIDVVIGKGASARSIRLELPKFTLIGATTRAGMLSAPLRDRFGVVNRLEFYTEEELVQIIKNSAQKLGVELDGDGAKELAGRSRGTPRLANRLLKRVRDFAQIKYNGVITKEVADFALDLLEVDKLGLDNTDRLIIMTLINNFGGGPVGIDALAVSIGEDAGTLEDVYEPYLVQKGLVLRTSRGRTASDAAYRHFGIGSDGLILICPSDVADFRMAMYNADGSEGKMCGNGVRCIAKYVYEYGLTDKKKISLETKSGIKYLDMDIEDGKVQMVKVDMGAPILKPAEIPVKTDSSMDSFINQPLDVDGNTFMVTCVSMGNPHAVVFVDDTKSLDIRKYGPVFETHPAFPEQVNTEFVQVISRNEINMRVWERGSGETLACGTGTCASVVACVLNGKTDEKVTVHLLGGDLFIEYNRDNGTVWMTGPAEIVFDGEIGLDI